MKQKFCIWWSRCNFTDTVNESVENFFCFPDIMNDTTIFFAYMHWMSVLIGRYIEVKSLYSSYTLRISPLSNRDPSKDNFRKKASTHVSLVLFLESHGSHKPFSYLFMYFYHLKALVIHFSHLWNRRYRK